jgi:hypothetical protein
MKTEQERNSPDHFRDENNLRKKIRETMQDMPLANPAERRVAEEWLYQKFLFGLGKSGEGTAAHASHGARRRKAVKPQDAAPMPGEHRIPLRYHGEFSVLDFEKLSFGLLPVSQEDKWFIWLDDWHLCFYRSGTRVCLYELNFEKTATGFRVQEAWVDRGFIEQNEWNSPAYAERLLEFLILRLLLGRPAPFPFPATVKKSVDRSMLRLGLMGKKIAQEDSSL